MRPSLRTLQAPVLGVLFLLGSLAALGDPGPPQRFANPLLDEVVRMARAEVPEATILAFLRSRRVRLESDVTARDLIDLHREGVADRVIEYIAAVSGVGDDLSASCPPQPEEAAPETGGPAAVPVDPDPADEPDEPVAQKPDPGDTGLIMGVYDPIPAGGYPCWPAWLAPWDCGDMAVVVRSGGPGSRFRDSRPEGRRTSRDRTAVQDAGHERRPADPTDRIGASRDRGDENNRGGGRVSPGRGDNDGGDRVSVGRGDGRGGEVRGDGRSRDGARGDSRGEGSRGRSEGSGSGDRGGTASFGGRSSGGGHGRH